ncbi:MAG: GGDEF domain-containing protein [Planctomycetes bacterium]|nr:GGDEF domain-containing protein [Planctomycetota bacterium]
MLEFTSYKDICDNTPLGIIVLDRVKKIHYWNEWLENMTTIRAENAIGKALCDLYPDFCHNRFNWAVDYVIANKSPQILSQALNHFVLPISIRSRGRHGLPVMQQYVQIFPMNGKNGEMHAIVFIQDVTESVIRSSEYAELMQKLREDSFRDPLTGIFNRRFMWDWLLLQLKRNEREKKPLACMMLDLDHFKRINDTYGHEKGDEVLKSFVEVTRRCLRNSDVFVRYGGEEFVAFLPDNELLQGIHTAQRVRESIAASGLASFKPGEITCSIGVSSWNYDNPCTGEDLLRNADKHLYKAKNNGRNQVVPVL